MRIIVKNLKFDTQEFSQEAESVKYFVLTSFDGANFVTPKSTLDSSTNSIKFENENQGETEAIINLSMAENHTKVIKFAVHQIQEDS